MIFIMKTSELQLPTNKKFGFFFAAVFLAATAYFYINNASSSVVSILGVVGEMERNQIKERQLEGIKIAKLKGNVYKGRKAGSKEDLLSFLNKDKNKKAVEYIKKGFKNTEVSKLTGLHINTLTKIKSILNQFSNDLSSSE